MKKSPYELIKSSDEAYWFEGLQALREENTPGSLDAVISMLSDNVWQKRGAAANALVEMTKDDPEKLTNYINENNLDELYWILNTLSIISDENACLIKPYLKHSSAEIRSYAVRAISNIKCLETARCLYPLVNDANWSIRKLVFEKLLDYKELILSDLRSMINNSLQSPHHSFIALFVIIGKDSIIPELDKAYKIACFSFKFIVVSSLGELQTPMAIDFIISKMSDPSYAIRKKASTQLLSIGEKVLDRLTAAFSKSDSLVRQEIISIIVKLLDSRSMPLIEKLLSSSGPEFKLLAMDNLTKLKSDHATSILISCLENSDRIISDYAADCITKKSNLNMDLILKHLNSSDESLRFQIIKIIGSIGGIALKPIISILESGNKQERLFLLGVLQRLTPDKQLMEILVKLLGDPQWPVRNSASNCLVYYNKASVPYIVRALNDENDDVRFWSRKALLKIGSDAVSVLKEILEAGTSPELTPHIVSALLSMDDPEAVPAVTKFIETSDEMKIESVFESVPKITSKNVISTILNLLSHHDDKVSKWLSLLLRKVDDSALRKVVFLGFSHSNERARYHVFEAISSWLDMTVNEIQSVCRQLEVEKSKKIIKSIVNVISQYDYDNCIDGLKNYLNRCESALMLDLMIVAASNKNPRQLQMLDSLLKEHAEVITISDADKVGRILGYVHQQNPDGLIHGLTAPGAAYRQCTLIALDSVEDRKVAFAIMENLLPYEEPQVIKVAVKTLAKYFFHDDFRLKGAITDFFLEMGEIITEPLSQVIQTLENELDKKALVDMIESVGGKVDPDILRSKSEKKIVLSDTHLDEVLERRKVALEELEKYDELIKTSHTKELAIMFTDVRGYTAFSSKASLSEVMSMLKQHDEILNPVFEKYEGETLKKIGDSFLVVFEKDNNAVLAAVEIQRKLKEFNENVSDERKLAIRIAINSGSVIRTENDVLGDTVNLASRLEGVGDAFDVVISENTLGKISKEIFDISSYGEHNLKGFDKPIKAYKVNWR